MKFRDASVWVAVFFLLSVAATPARAQWQTAPHMQELHGNLGGAVDAEGRVYAIGGRNDPYNTLQIDGKVERFDEYSGLWSYVSPLQTPRFYLGSATDLTRDRIYAAGGRSAAGDVLASVEYYSPATGQWTYAHSMLQARMDEGLVADSQGRVYAIGGSSLSSGGGALSSVERYDPTTDTWSSLAPLSAPRTSINAAIDSMGRIYAIGGSPGSSGFTSIVERYDPATNQWQTIAPLSSARDVAAACTGPDGLIYAIGGYGGSYTTTVQRYDPATNVWSTADSILTGRNNSGVAVTPSGHIYLFGGDIDYYRTDSMEMLSVPEPATLSLLALGGSWPCAAAGADRLHGRACNESEIRMTNRCWTPSHGHAKAKRDYATQPFVPLPVSAFLCGLCDLCG